jgi:hypothetical protein
MQIYTVKVYKDGEVHWLDENGERHREDGPAIEKPNEFIEWWVNGKLHKEDGPAIEYADGSKEYWLNGKQVTEQEVMGHTIIIDGKEVKISAESYKNLKENL